MIFVIKKWRNYGEKDQKHRGEKRRQGLLPHLAGAGFWKSAGGAERAGDGEEKTVYCDGHDGGRTVCRTAAGGFAAVL